MNAKQEWQNIDLLMFSNYLYHNTRATKKSPHYQDIVQQANAIDPRFFEMSNEFEMTTDLNSFSEHFVAFSAFSAPVKQQLQHLIEDYRAEIESHSVSNEYTVYTLEEYESDYQSPERPLTAAERAHFHSDSNDEYISKVDHKKNQIMPTIPELDGDDLTSCASDDTSDSISETYSLEDYESDYQSPEKPLSAIERAYFGHDHGHARPSTSNVGFQESEQAMVELLKYMHAHAVRHAERTQESTYILSRIKASCPKILSKINASNLNDTLKLLSLEEKTVLSRIAKEEQTAILSFNAKFDSDDESKMTDNESIDPDGPHHS
ncbi:MAG: hypothetical protein CK424_03825 [Legionella sp.]|nr:MAG: hypothetical protein CK424_03825 [Legionella sp.]